MSRPVLKDIISLAITWAVVLNGTFSLAATPPPERPKPATPGEFYFDDYPKTIRVCLKNCRTKKAKIVDVEFKQYIRDVMAKEMGLAYFHPEAVKTGAILAKQYALYHAKIMTKKHPSYDVGATEADQVYIPGYFEKHFRRHPEAKEMFRQAVDETWDLIILRNGQIFESQYDSGREVANGVCRVAPLKPGRVSQHGAHDLAMGCKGKPAHGRSYTMEEILDYYYEGPGKEISVVRLPTSKEAEASGFGPFRGNFERLTEDSTVEGSGTPLDKNNVFRRIFRQPKKAESESKSKTPQVRGGPFRVPISEGKSIDLDR